MAVTESGSHRRRVNHWHSPDLRFVPTRENLATALENGHTDEQTQEIAEEVQAIVRRWPRQQTVCLTKALRHCGSASRSRLWKRAEPEYSNAGTRHIVPSGKGRFRLGSVLR